MKKPTPAVVDMNKLSETERKYPFANLLQWTRENNPKEDLLYKGAFDEQICFVRDTCFYKLFLGNLKTIQVVSTHRSKSVELPVYHVVLIDGTEFILRDNFYNWKVTVLCDKHLMLPIDLFSHIGNHSVKEGKISHHYCEGFHRDWIFPIYNYGDMGGQLENRKRFTVELHSNYELFTMIFLIREQLQLIPTN